MKVMKNILITLISVGLTSTPVAANTQTIKKNTKQIKTVQKKYHHLALNLVKRELKVNGDKYFNKIELMDESKVEDLQSASDESAKFIQMIDDSSYSLKEIQKELVQRILSEEMAQKNELSTMIGKMDIEKVDELFEKAMDKGNYPSHLEMEYFGAYTEAEKKSILLKVLSSDLMNIKSNMIKRIGMLKRSDLRREFETTQNIMGMSLYSKNKKDRQQILITILTIAAAGLASWAIISHTKKRYERKLEKEQKRFERETEAMLEEYERLTEELHQHHDSEIERMLREHEQLMSDTQFDYDQRMAELREIFSDRERLREEGYTWQICKVEEQLITQTCSYDHQTYTGTKKCVSHCLVAPDGTKVGETSLVCTNNNTPLNCSNVNPTDSGSYWGDIDGYDDGYDDGYADHYDDAYDRAYDDLYWDGYDDGRSEGYSDGFNEGYADGLAQGEYDSDLSYDEGYDEGYSDGYFYATGSYY